MAPLAFLGRQHNKVIAPKLRYGDGLGQCLIGELLK